MDCSSLGPSRSDKPVLANVFSLLWLAYTRPTPANIFTPAYVTCPQYQSCTDHVFCVMNITTACNNCYCLERNILKHCLKIHNCKCVKQLHQNVFVLPKFEYLHVILTYAVKDMFTQPLYTLLIYLNGLSDNQFRIIRTRIIHTILLYYL